MFAYASAFSSLSLFLSNTLCVLGFRCANTHVMNGLMYPCECLFSLCIFLVFTYPKKTKPKRKKRKQTKHTHIQHFSHQMISFPFSPFGYTAFFSASLFLSAYGVCIYDFFCVCCPWQQAEGEREKENIHIPIGFFQTDVYQTVWLVKYVLWCNLIWIPLVWKIQTSTFYICVCVSSALRSHFVEVKKWFYVYGFWFTFVHNVQKCTLAICNEHEHCWYYVWIASYRNHIINISLYSTDLHCCPFLFPIGHWDGDLHRSISSTMLSYVLQCCCCKRCNTYTMAIGSCDIKDFLMGLKILRDSIWICFGLSIVIALCATFCFAQVLSSTTEIDLLKMFSFSKWHKVPS